MHLNFVLDENTRRQMYEEEIKRADETIINSKDLNEVYYAYQRKQEYERLLGRNKGA